MSEIVTNLVNSSRIVEWLDPNDVRLVHATDEPAPNSGGDIREEWSVDGYDEQLRVASEIRRLLIPDESLMRGMMRVVFANDAWQHEDELGYGNVVVTMDEAEDWRRVFPVDRSRIFKRKGLRAWGAVALCDQPIGLAVFAKEVSSGGVISRIQRVPDEILAKIRQV